jgi:hypothetical protein
VSETEDDLKRELLEMDIKLRRKQVFWETPKAILLIVATTATIAGLLGYKIGSTPQVLTVRVLEPVPPPQAPVIVQPEHRP